MSRVLCAGVAAVQDRLADVRGREAVLVLRGGGAVPAVGAPRPRAHLQDGGGNSCYKRSAVSKASRRPKNHTNITNVKVWMFVGLNV